MGEVTGTRERIVEAAVDSLVARGWDRTTIAEVARRAGVSRPTVYAHFATRDDLFVEVSGRAAQRISEQVVARAAASARTGADFVVEVVASAVQAYRADPSASLVGLIRPDQALGPEGLAVARAFLSPLAELAPEVADDLDEVAETLMRFVVTLMLRPEPHRSDAELRAYLRRRLVPALHLGGEV